MGVESHAQLRGDVSVGVASFGTTAALEHTIQDVAALLDLRLVQTLFQAVDVPPYRCATLRRPRGYSNGSKLVGGGQTAHCATAARRLTMNCVRTKRYCKGSRLPLTKHWTPACVEWVDVAADL